MSDIPRFSARSRTFRLACIATAIGLIVVGCATSGSPAPAPESGPASGFGPGISVAEATSSRLEGPLLVNGWLWRSGRDVRLCTSLTSGTPPQCGEPSIAVSGVDTTEMKGMQTAAGVIWSVQMIQLLGSVKNDTLVVEGQSKG